MDVRLRAPRADEADAIAALINAHNRRLWGVDGVTTEIVEHWFTNPLIDPERDITVAEDAEGSLVGYGDVSDGKEEKTRFWIDLRLLQAAGHETGIELLARLEARARERAAPGALARGVFSAPDRLIRRVFAASGYELVRHSLRMERPLHAEVEPAVWPEGLSVQSAAGADLEPLWRAVEEGFADHWEYEPHPLEDFLHWSEAPNHDLALWFVAMDGDQLAGACLCATEEWGAPGTGHIASLSVRPAWRRRGLALALLLHSFEALRERGSAHVSLMVDAENTTGAVRLYERAGMRMSRRYDLVDKPLD